jgi:hypothetical protein
VGEVTITNPELTFTLDDAVAEVLTLLTGLDLSYRPELDRYATITRQLNRALRANALEHEWGYYSTVQSAGPAVENDHTIWLPADLRPRVVGDDAVRLVNEDGQVIVWAFVLPRDALSKYWARAGLWCAVTRNAITFSRPFSFFEAGLDIQVPAMREPVMFRLPPTPEDPNTAPTPVPQEIRDQPIDFAYPDVVILRAAWYVSLTDPVMQPRAQTLEAQYKDLMYQIIERDDRFTDSPYQNEFTVPIQASLFDQGFVHAHPHSDERRI